MFVQKKILFFSFIFIITNTLISASEEPILPQNIMQKIESWASFTTDGSWEDSKKDFFDFLEKIEQIKFLAEKGSFLDDDENDSDDESDNESMSDENHSLEDGEESEDEADVQTITNKLIMNIK